MLAFAGAVTGPPDMSKPVGWKAKLPAPVAKSLAPGSKLERRWAKASETFAPVRAQLGLLSRSAGKDLAGRLANQPPSDPFAEPPEEPGPEIKRDLRQELMRSRRSGSLGLVKPPPPAPSLPRSGLPDRSGRPIERSDRP